MVRSGAPAGTLAATAPSRSGSTARDNPVVTARLRSSIRTTRSHRSQGRVEAGEALPEEATSLGGSSVQAARLSTWWKRPGGSLALTARLSHLQPQTFRQIYSPEKGPRYPGNGGGWALTSFADPVVNVVAQLRPRFPKTGTHRQDAFSREPDSCRDRFPCLLLHAPHPKTSSAVANTKRSCD
jgi:hypothetical protein